MTKDEDEEEIERDDSEFFYTEQRTNESVRDDLSDFKTESLSEESSKIEIQVINPPVKKV